MPKKGSALSTKLSGFPRLGLAHLPTPLEPMRRLTEHVGGPRLWVKREDATGVGFGGNKLRKLDYLLHEAIAAKADTLVSGGVVQSNSQRQIAALSIMVGFRHRRRSMRHLAMRFSTAYSVPTCTMFLGPAIAMARSRHCASGYARKGDGPISFPMAFRMRSAPLAMLRP